MTILGGMGTLSGGLFGALLYVCLEYFLSQATEHWQIIFGPIIVLFVLFVGRGVMGLLPARRGSVV
jgi:branched-chain amino acid transport system permease protein